MFANVQKHAGRSVVNVCQWTSPLWSIFVRLAATLCSILFYFTPPNNSCFSFIKERNWDQDHPVKFTTISWDPPPTLSTTTCTLPSCAKKAYNTKSLSHCGNNPHIKYQQDTTGLYIGQHASSFHITICIHSDSRTCRSFRMQRDGILQQENRHVSTYTLTRSHTAMMKKTPKQYGKKELPYHFSHWSSIQPSPPSPPESML